jgi:Flp pilus assembly protein TadD
VSAPGSTAVVPRSSLRERLLNLAFAVGTGGLLLAFVGGFAYLISLHGGLPLRTDPLLGARQYLKRGNVAGAVNQFRIAYLLNATDLRSLNELGELLLRDRRYEESASAFAQALSLKPDSRAENGMAEVRFAQGRYADAAESFERSLRLRPQQPGVLNDLGMARALDGDFERAIAAFDASLAMAPNERTRANLERAKADRARAAAAR